MKKLLPTLLLFMIITLNGCKKDKSAPDNDANNNTIVATISALQENVLTAGMSVAVSGTNFPNAASEIKVYFNGVEAQVITSSSYGFIVTVPVTKSGNIKAIIGGHTISGPAFTYIAPPVINSFSPAILTKGTEVTISGTNFQVSGLTTSVWFNGVTAEIKSITGTEIKVIAPQVSNGKITVVLTPQITALSAPYTYVSAALVAPYTSGDVILGSQSDVDTFVAMNKGKQVQISGDLQITGGDITSVADLSLITSVSGKVSINYTPALAHAPFLNNLTQVGSFSFVYSGFEELNFNNLQNFTGSLYLSSNAKLTRISFSALTNPAYVSVYYSPLLTDLDFLRNVAAIGSVSLMLTGATSLNMDNVKTISSLTLNNCPKLTSVSMRSLTNTTGTNASGITISQCSALATTNFNMLETVAGKLTVSGTGITDINGFTSLVNAGALTLIGNSDLADLQGLKRLNNITLPAITSAANAGVVNFNGLDIESNPKLASLNGLQNISSLPLLTIRSNASLNDFCPFKKQILTLSKLPAYTYKYTPCCDFPIGYYKTGLRAALTLTSNGSYSANQDVLDALALCK